ncbi:four-carbon acid sugar kinase family protein [Brevibacterium renqingii]|uniref:four-carbon acid sugar kinase family protein n=1 Tax=Brevibacterium renqingii TaxID=2776916 RepID=UPI0020A29CF6|nr:four-carbon acid sugar kinase family protein [Brevibacterium renqingii]
MSERPMPQSGTAGTCGADPRILIVADDLTGGNACGALFAEAGLRTITVSANDQEAAVGLGGFLDDYDAVVVNADSRHLPSQDAAELTEALIAAAGDVDLVSCRIDTTLRGNVGATAEAALRARRRLVASADRQRDDGRHRRVLGLCIPAFPDADRTTVGGRQLLDGRLLEHTELRHDVRSPMLTSDVEEILRSGTDLECRLIEISSVLEGRSAIRAEVLEAIRSGAEVIIADALTTAHVELVGSVVAEVSAEIAEISMGTPPSGSRKSAAEVTGRNVRDRAGLPPDELLDWVTIDPGPGSLSLALSLLPTRSDEVLLGISGSATEVTRMQLAELAGDPTVALIRTVLDEDSLPDVDTTLERVEEAASARAIIIATVLESGDLLELSDEESETTTRRLAMIAAAIMHSVSVTGLYTTGGDVTATVMRELGAVGMEVEKEIVPLAVGGRLVGGRADGLPIVTKGGLIGGPTTAAHCFEYLKATSRVRRE